MKSLHSFVVSLHRNAAFRAATKHPFHPLGSPPSVARTKLYLCISLELLGSIHKVPNLDTTRTSHKMYNATFPRSRKRCIPRTTRGQNTILVIIKRILSIARAETTDSDKKQIIELTCLCLHWTPRTGVFITVLDIGHNSEIRNMSTSLSPAPSRETTC